MKTRFLYARPPGCAATRGALNTRICKNVILMVSLTTGGVSIAQTNTPSAAASSAGPGGSTNVTQLAPVTVVGKLDVARNQIMPDLGATTYTINESQIQALPEGQNTPFNQVLLRAPGVAEDSLRPGARSRRTRQPAVPH